eukprot:4863153-Pyramimonas_sp.AAC.1
MTNDLNQCSIETNSKLKAAIQRGAAPVPGVPQADKCGAERHGTDQCQCDRLNRVSKTVSR